MQLLSPLCSLVDEREREMDWEGGFSTNSPEFLMLDGDMEEFRSEKSVKAGKVRFMAAVSGSVAN